MEHENKVIIEVQLLDGDNINFYYIDKRQTTVILHDINIDMTNLNIALHNINLFCEKLKKLNKNVLYIQHYADKTEYLKNKELYDKFHVKIVSDTAICLTCEIDSFPLAFWKCLGWKD